MVLSRNNTAARPEQLNTIEGILKTIEIKEAEQSYKS